MRWTDGRPVLAWEGGPRSPLGAGMRIAFRVADQGVRTCVGARDHACPRRAAVPAHGTGARCDACARLDRAHSVAADTLDDPRPYRVYLAWFGPGLVKAGITAEARGPARLLEQGAICFTWLGTGPLMAARRAEEVLRAALGVPDRVPYAAKRAVRAGLTGDPAARAAELAALHARALALDGLPESLRPAPFAPVDHTEAFGLDGLPAAQGEVTGLVPGGRIVGRLQAVAGPDLHLLAETGGEPLAVVLDTRLLPGWDLFPVTDPEDGPALTVPVRRRPRAGGVQDGLFPPMR